METGLGSPRSSSGYGSSEEDHQACSNARRRRRTTVATHCAAAEGRAVGSPPQTPLSLSPSDTGSSLSSPNSFSVDFRSIFDDSELGVMPDFSDLAAFSAADGLDDVALPVEFWTGEMGTWTNDFDGANRVLPSAKPSSVDGVQPVASNGCDKRDDSHILASLLKRPKDELDWITTGHHPTPAVAEQFLTESNRQVERAREMGLDTIDAANASPLQRLRALTHSNVVNHTAAAPSVELQKTPTVIRAGVALGSTVPIRVVPQNGTGRSHDGRTLIVRRQTSSQTVSARSQLSSSPSAATVSVITTRRASDTKPVQMSRSNYPERRRSSPGVTSAARTSGAPVAVRRVRSELDDHRYSTPIPPSAPQRPWPLQSSIVTAAKSSRSRGRQSADARCPPRRPSTTFRRPSSSSSTSSSSCSSSSSVLEMLLRTSKRLRPNDGSDASLAACRGVPPAKRPSWRRRSEVSYDHHDETLTESSSSSGSHTTFLESLLVDSAVAALTPEEAAVGTGSGTTESTSSELLSTPGDTFSLFSEHLLCDSQGVIDVGLLTDDLPAWTPSRLDDKVMSSELEEIMQEQVRQDDTWLQQYLSELL